MKRKVSLWTALILAGNLLLSTGYSAIGIGSQTAHAANEFNVGISPAQGEMNVNVSSNIKLSFDRLVSPQSGNITVTAQGTSEPYVTIPVGSSGLISSSTEYQVKLGKTLEYNKTYTVNVPQGMFKDNLGLESLGATSTFTTAPSINSAITATEYTPANYSRVDSSLTQLSLKLNKKLQRGGGSIRLIASADNSVVQEFKIKEGEPYVYLYNDSATSTTTVSLTLTSRLTAGSSYYVLIDPYALKDDDNKSFAGITTGNVWSFSIKGSAVPGITVSPSNGAGAVAVSTEIQLTFDQPMMPAAGVISVSPSNTANARYFNVNSASVTGGGTRFIKVASASAANPLLSNTQYTVTIPQGAFYDQDGNVFPASGPYTWTFTTTSLTGFGITSLSPADRSEAVQINQPIKITFNQPAWLQGTSGIALYKSNGTKIATTVEGSSLNSKEFTIIPATTLDNDTIYYIDIAPGIFTDAGNNPFEGINGRNAWSFKTVALDKTAPLLSSASLESNRTIRLKYDEALNSGVSLMLGSFAVTVNEEKRNIDSVYIQGDSVYVTLSTGVAVGQVIRISYIQGIRMIEDLSGNAAGSFTARVVTNNIQSVLPTPKDGILTGKTLVLNFNDQLRTASAAGYNQFYVYADGTSLGVNAMSSSGSSVTLGLNNVASSVQSVRVTYYAGSYPLQDQFGQNIASFSDFYVRNTSDTVAPVYQSASGSDKQIILTYNEGLSPNSLPLVSQYSVLVGSTPNYVTNVAVSGNQVTLTLASALSTGSYTTVSYVPGTAGISDLNGNRASYINLQPVSVSGSSVTTNVPNISSATITGDELTVNFSKSMQASSTLYSGQFAVRVDGSMVGVQSFTVSGATLKLVLSTVVKAGQTVDLSYMTGAGSILDLSGTALASFTALAVQNLTGTAASTSSRPSYLGILAASEFGKEYPLLKSDSATTADDRSVYNQVVKRYMLAADRLTASYEYLYKLGTPSLVFEVPQTELAAYVSVPLKPLLDAVNRNSKSAFGIRYGDTLYNLALDDVNMNSLAAALIADSSTISLVIRLEKVPSGTYTPFEQKLRSQGLQTVTSLTDIRMSAVVSGNYSNGTVLSSPGEYTVRTTATLNSDQTSVARLDLVYYDTTYLPTKISSAGSYTVIRANTTGNQVVGTFLSIRSFTDMSKHWAKSTVALLAAKNIIDSSYGTTFKPEQKVTRAEFAVMLSRGLGLLGDRETAQRFSDIQSSTQTGDYIGAAAKAGIITGNTDGSFRPNDNITREQLAIMIIRAMEYTEHPITLSGTAASALSAFKDRNKIQNAAAEFVAKAVQEGIILGMTTTEFQPQGNATRAQAAVMLQRMLGMAGYL